MYYKNFGKFQRRRFKKITNKAIKRVKNAFVWAFITDSRHTDKILTEIIHNKTILHHRLKILPKHWHLYFLDYFYTR